MQPLRDKVAVVTGGASGIGKGSAVALANAGAHVLVADLAADRAADAAAAITAGGGTASGHALDVADPSAVAAFFDEVEAVHGRLDVLFHAAAIQFQRTAVVDTTDECWDRFIRTNLSGTFYVCRAAVPVMSASGGGSITLMASGRVFMGSAGDAAYAASKGGVASFTRSLAWEVGRDGINVNCLVPGVTDTDGTRRFQREVLGEDPEEVVARFAAADPMGRVSTPEDIASMVRYLATDGRWITGQMHTLRVYTW